VGSRIGFPADARLRCGREEPRGVRDGGSIGGGFAVDGYAGEVRVDGVAGCGGRAGVGDLLTGVFQAGDGGLGEGADNLLEWRQDAEVGRPRLPGSIR